MFIYFLQSAVFRTNCRFSFNLFVFTMQSNGVCANLNYFNHMLLLLIKLSRNTVFYVKCRLKKEGRKCFM